MTSPAAGRMPWADALAGPLTGVTCLWQDLDGLHVERAPASPPPTSVLWGWCEQYLVRIRLDGDTAFVAVHDPAGKGDTAPGVATRLLAWGSDDGRIAASHGRGPAAADGGVGATYEQIVADGAAAGTGPVTFLRPARPGSERAAGT